MLWASQPSNTPVLICAVLSRYMQLLQGIDYLETYDCAAAKCVSFE